MVAHESPFHGNYLGSKVRMERKETIDVQEVGLANSCLDTENVTDKCLSGIDQLT